jgi:hypothetical protein
MSGTAAVGDASHRKAIEKVEDRLFGGAARNGPKLAAELKDTTLGSTSVN